VSHVDEPEYTPRAMSRSGFAIMFPQAPKAGTNFFHVFTPFTSMTLAADDSQVALSLPPIIYSNYTCPIHLVKYEVPNETMKNNTQ
jgi:hypothetical protein